MARRRPCWIILAGAEPTAFWSPNREDLVPTLKQLQRTHPETVLKWFERGRLWDSPEEARNALLAARRRTGPKRGPDWRPGGRHVDPRAKYALSRDEKRARFKRRLVESKTRPARPSQRSRPRKPKP